MSEASTVREISGEILRYLERYPDAKDTLDGIAQWWIRCAQKKYLRGEVERAVAFLLAKGLLLELRRQGVPPYYQLNPQQREAIPKLLEGL
jgi:hypothetical protein